MTPTLELLRPRRLVVWIYVVGLLQIAVISIAFSLLRTYVLESPWKTSILQRTRYMVYNVAAHRGDPEALRREAMRIKEDLGATLSLYAPGGTLLCTNTEPPLPPLPPAELLRLGTQHALTRGSPLSSAVAVEEGGVMVAYGVFAQAPPPVPFSHTALSIAIAIICVGVGSLLFARALARPLERLAQVARAFGAGDLEARARLNRRDEFGQLGRAFDEMADRVTHLLRSQKELLANISHELRTPLSRIRVALDIATEGAEGAEGSGDRESLAEITEDLGELERLVDDVLAAARLDLATGKAGASGQPLHLQQVDPGALVDKAVGRFRANHPARQLEVEVDGPLPLLEADATLLRRVIDNLLDNARKYSDPGSVVRLRAYRAEAGAAAEVVVEVMDHGIGIDEADLPQLFTPFFRSDRSRARKTGGVGLGLALARRVVEAHRGRIAVTSKAGKGTTVRFRIPVPGPVAAGPSTERPNQ